MVMSIEDVEKAEEIPISGKALITWKLPSGETKSEFMRRIVDRGKYIKAYPTKSKGGMHYRIPKDFIISVE